MLNALTALQSVWEACRDEDNPFCNTGAQYDGRNFQVHAYSWSDDDQPFNFAWRDVRVSWYKYLGRGTTVNRKMEREEIRAMLRECLSEI